MKKILLLAFLGLILMAPVFAYEYNQNDYSDGLYGTGELPDEGSGGSGHILSGDDDEEVEEEVIEEDLSDTNGIIPEKTIWGKIKENYEELPMTWIIISSIVLLTIYFIFFKDDDNHR